MRIGPLVKLLSLCQHVHVQLRELHQIDKRDEIKDECLPLKSKVPRVWHQDRPGLLSNWQFPAFRPLIVEAEQLPCHASRIQHDEEIVAKVADQPLKRFKLVERIPCEFGDTPRNTSHEDSPVIRGIIPNQRHHEVNDSKSRKDLFSHGNWIVRNQAQRRQHDVKRLLILSNQKVGFPFDCLINVNVVDNLVQSERPDQCLEHVVCHRQTSH